MNSYTQSCLPFTLVLGGGGARGFAHVGVLRALDSFGLRPSAIVGVSMGAVVGTTYSLREDWYDALLEMDSSAFPGPLSSQDKEQSRFMKRIKGSLLFARAAKDLFFGWGLGIYALKEGRSLLSALTGGRDLEDGRIPVSVAATDLKSGKRFVIRSGRADQAIYASSALAGVLPPLVHKGHLLADGAYADIAPIDVARAYGHPVVIAVDPSQDLLTSEIKNGYHALMRAMEICHLRHADARFSEADLVLKPSFQRTIDTLDFGARRECIAAGKRAVRKNQVELVNLLRAESRSTDKVESAMHTNPGSRSSSEPSHDVICQEKDKEDQDGMGCR